MTDNNSTSSSRKGLQQTDFGPDNGATGSSNIAFRPKPASPWQSKPRDITAQFTRASSILDVGQLIKDESFTLYESVSALEIMDPKMDSGFLEHGESMDDDYDVLRQVESDEVLGIIDQMLCYEMAWHEGYPLSQTLFMSLYIERLLRKDDVKSSDSTIKDMQFSMGEPVLHNDFLHIVLRAYSLALIKCCDFVLQRIVSEHYYEEEDFVTHTYDRQLMASIPVQEVISELDDAIVWLDGHIRAGQSSTFETSSTAMYPARQVLNALGARLTWRKAFLEALDVSKVPQEYGKLWSTSLALVSALKETYGLGTPVPEAASGKAQRRLASTVPPRPMVVLTFDTAIVRLGQIHEDNIEACKLLDYTRIQSPHNIIAFLWTFSSRKPQPLTYSRALLQSLLPLTTDACQLMFQDASELVLGGDELLNIENWEVEAPHDARHVMARTVDTVLQKAQQDYVDLYRALCQNRCRQRRVMPHVAQGYENVQFEIEPIELQIQSITKEEPLVDAGVDSEPMYAYPFSSWLYHHKLRMMQWWIQLGFELDTYLPDELAGMYWYLSELASKHYAHLIRIRLFIDHRKQQHEKRKATIQACETQANLDFVDALGYEACAVFYMSDALSALYAVLNRFDLIAKPPRLFGSGALRYEARMKAISTISQPEAPDFPTFEDGANPKTSFKGLLASAETRLKEAKQALAKLKSWEKSDSESSAKRGRLAKYAGLENARGQMLSSMLKSIVATGIAIANLRMALGRNDGHLTKSDLQSAVKVEVPEPGDRYHDWWIIPKITVVKS